VKVSFKAQARSQMVILLDTHIAVSFRRAAREQLTSEEIGVVTAVDEVVAQGF
jgi:hypothetical protein